MEDKPNLIEPLFEKIQGYVKTSYELEKLKVLDKATVLASSIILRIIFIAVICLFTIIISIGFSLWLGEKLGEYYYGFFLVGGFYLIISIILLIIRQDIREKIGNAIINQLLNKQ